MRELGRGESIVAATIATLSNRSSVDAKSQAVHSRQDTEAERKVLRSPRNNIYQDQLRRVSGISERPLSTASETSDRDSVSIQSSEEPPSREST